MKNNEERQEHEEETQKKGPKNLLVYGDSDSKKEDDA